MEILRFVGAVRWTTNLLVSSVITKKCSSSCTDDELDFIKTDYGGYFEANKMLQLRARSNGIHIGYF